MADAALADIRTTRPRPEGSRSPVASFSGLRDAIQADRLLERQPIRYVLLLVVLFAALGATIAAFVLVGDSWFQLLVAAASGIVFTQFAFFSHEAAHRQVLAAGPANDRLGLWIGNGIVGMSYQWWMSKHTRHHANPNQLSRDPDIEIDVFSFHEEAAAGRRGLAGAFTRRQAWVFFPMLLLEGLNLYYQSYRSLLRRGKVQGRAIELTLLTVRVAIIAGAVFWMLPLGMAFAFLGVQAAVFGLYMGSVFAVNHIGMPIIPREAKLDFLRKQVLTSRNIGGGVWMSAFMGGLNYQIEHHLFPSMPRFSLARARRIVREHCRAEDIPYTEMNILRAWVAVTAYLNRVGGLAPSPFTCPIASAYGRRV